MILENIKESIEYIGEQSSIKPKIGLTLGSGLASFADEIDIDCRIPYSEIPNFVPPTVDGHPGQLVLGHINSVPIVVLQGRIHYYEGHSMEQVVFPTRVIAQICIETLVLTNAAGGIDPQMQPGDFMIISDHINLTGNNPLIGPNIHELGLRFPDMSEAYDVELNKKLSKLLSARKVRHSFGVYCGVSGPTYETAAEVRFLQKIGGSAVGMSTVPETIAAKHMGLRVCGISCITNLATGISKGKVTHEEVKETAKKVEVEFIHFLKEFLGH
ncbi:MAG: purine-nucleoside phosphorylase [Bdellovibrionales bacterium]|nr:purine-nucleoside phosphorylase [Bdellovibrionales bacterium]